MKRLGSLRYNVFPECVADDPAVPEVGVAPVAKVGVASAAPPPPPEPSALPYAAVGNNLPLLGPFRHATY